MDSNTRQDPSNISEWFWGIIDSAQGRPAQLTTHLRLLSNNDLYHFAIEFMFAADLLCKDSIIDQMEYASEDNILDFSHWAVSQGKGFYYSLWSEPQLVATYPGSSKASSTNLHAIAESVLEERTGEWPEDIIDIWDDFGESPYSSTSKYWETRERNNS